MSSIFNPTGARARSRFLQVVFLVFIFIPHIAPLSLVGAFSSDQPQTGQDLWYVIKIGGNTVGYLHENLRSLPARTPEGQGSTLQTTSELPVALNRLGFKVELSFVSLAEESAEGRPRRFPGIAAEPVPAMPRCSPLWPVPPVCPQRRYWGTSMPSECSEAMPGQNSW